MLYRKMIMFQTETDFPCYISTDNQYISNIAFFTM